MAPNKVFLDSWLWPEEDSFTEADQAWVQTMGSLEAALLLGP